MPNAPKATPYSGQPTIRLRTPKRLMSTTYGNEIADAVNKNRVLPRFGQQTEEASGAIVSITKPQYQGMDFTGIVNNRPGWDWDSFIPPFGSF